MFMSLVGGDNPTEDPNIEKLVGEILRPNMNFRHANWVDVLASCSMIWLRWENMWGTVWAPSEILEPCIMKCGKSKDSGDTHLRSLI